MKGGREGLKLQDEIISKRHIADEVDLQKRLDNSARRKDALDRHQESVLVRITSKYRRPYFWLAKLDNTSAMEEDSKGIML